MTIHPIIPTPDLRAQLIGHLRSSEGSDISWAAEVLKASYVAVEDALDAMVEEDLAFKDGSYDPAVYPSRAGRPTRVRIRIGFPGDCPRDPPRTRR